MIFTNIRQFNITLDVPQPYNKIGDGPEGPEVKYIIHQIEKKFKGAKLTDIYICSGRYSRHNKPNGMDKFLSMLPLTIKGFHTKGKFAWIDLGKGVTVWLTFGLTGELITKQREHCHITFVTNRGEFYMQDVRNFGTLSFHFTEAELDKKLKTLGPDPLSTTITNKQFIELMRAQGQNRQIGLVLMDNKVITGIGNYLRAEVLYASKVSPHRKLKDISDKELETILKEIKSIMKASYQTQIKKGIHTYKFKVYKRDSTPKGETIKAEKWSNRTIWWVPTVQK